MDRARLNASELSDADKQVSHGQSRATIRCASIWLAYETEWNLELASGNKFAPSTVQIAQEREKILSRLLRDTESAPLVARFIAWNQLAQDRGLIDGPTRAALAIGTGLSEREAAVVLADPASFFAEPQAWMRQFREKLPEAQRRGMDASRARNARRFLPRAADAYFLIGLPAP